MTLSSLFRKKKVAAFKTISVLRLQPQDLCYYDHFSEPFEVSDVGLTQRSVFYVEIRHLRTGKTHLFTDDYPVKVSETIFQQRN
ncbi:MAG: hypothetical protein HC913_23785 [Microscillaceae bacterium]|nr:hypothetical protein [Microscillaceae bacterium]